jgi:hypothetical protein
VRLWSLHPKYLDRQGLLAVWREGLLAQAVLRGETKGYTRHPQLDRFRAAPDPLGAIAAYLAAIADEAEARGYRFDRAKILAAPTRRRMSVTRGQLDYEFRLLRRKLRVPTRDPQRAATLARVTLPEPHPLFAVTDGPTADWERVKPTA